MTSRTKATPPQPHLLNETNETEPTRPRPKHPATTAGLAKTVPELVAIRTLPKSLQPISEIESRSTEWAWQSRIPFGELTLLDGDPGNGKSCMFLDLAARISTGTPFPQDKHASQGGVLLLLGEDSIAKTVRRRLEAAKADLTKIIVPNRKVVLPRDLPFLEEAICCSAAKLVVIDPLMAFIGTDSNSDQKMRTVLTPLHEIAEKTNCAIVMVRHLNKRGGGYSLYRGSGSIGIIAATRSAMLIGKSPDEPNLRVLVHTKSNLGPLTPSLLFEPVDVDGVPQIEWRGECEYTADDVLASQNSQTSRFSEAMAFLTEILADGSVEQKEVKQRAIATGLAYRTVERAKEVLGVVSERKGWGPGSQCFWRLVGDDKPSSP